MNFWYRKNYLATLLLPSALLYRTIISIRKAMYDKQYKKTYRFPIPIIVVGNITVGGTGKTPLVIWLAKWLQRQGYRPGIVSRGYKATIKSYPFIVTPTTTATEVGDEAILLFRNVQCSVAIDPNRPRAIQALIAQKQVNIIITDDGLQHYAMDRDIEIAVVDGQRRYGNNYCLPAGPLREPLSRLQDIDFIVSKGQAEQGEYVMHLLPQAFLNVQDNNLSLELDNFNGQTVHAIAGIGNPSSFFNSLTTLGINVIAHIFPDHYVYREQDLNFQDNLPIIMTEKDAVKCQHFMHKNLWYLAVIANVPEQFADKLLVKLEKCCH